ncbi:hypothetical protein R3W88_024711 [Solanum pinnatisectum]|uniref:RNase H type-1 domain-containing protein n=1 Tax=Solanum pinnatisectum TaxID=50273 RepID=A0AAV9M0Y5_9SOLN|nr:hypothetical protein R3W88_024711 [Solanum pinnatisectum]
MWRTIKSGIQSFSCSMILWMKPDSDWVKLNFDGCCNGNSETSDGSGIIRNHNGYFLITSADFYGYCSNNMVEAKALAQRLKICVDEGTPNFKVKPKRNQFVINDE